MFLAYYTLEELLDIYVNRWSYFKSGWNVFDVLIIIMGFLNLGYSLSVHIQAIDLLKKVADSGGNTFVDFSGLGDTQVSRL